MVRRMLVGIVTVVALLAAQQASAQTVVYLGGGASFPVGDFGDYANTGWQAVGGILVPVGPEGLSGGIEVFYGQNNHKDEVSVLENSKTTPFGAMGTVDYTFQTSGKLSPYVFGGLGVLIHRFSADNVDSESDTQFGYEGGAGVAFALSPKLGLWVEGRYTGSSDTQFFGANAGLAFTIGGGE